MEVLSIHREIIDKYQDLIRPIVGEKSFLYRKLSEGLHTILSGTLDNRFSDVLKDTSRQVDEGVCQYTQTSDIEYLPKGEVLDLPFFDFAKAKKRNAVIKDSVTRYFNFVFNNKYKKEYQKGLEEIWNKFGGLENKDIDWEEVGKEEEVLHNSYKVRHIVSVPLEEVATFRKNAVGIPIGPKRIDTVIRYFKNVFNIEIGKPNQ